MPDSFTQKLDELLLAGVISDDTRERILSYYALKKSTSQPNRLILVFGILGALLVGLGAILIIAHNWDSLPRYTRLLIAFLPLIASQVFCGITTFGRKARQGLKEVAATCLFFAVGSSLALVSQIYHIEGNLAGYLLAWSLLYIPVIYLLRSSIASLLSLVLIGYYGIQAGYFNYNQGTNWYFLLLAAIIPYYVLLLRKEPRSNSTVFHHWVLAISVTIILASVSRQLDELMFAAYASLFGCFYLAGNLPFFRKQKRRSSGYLVIGSLGTIVLLLISSFQFLWEELIGERFAASSLIASPELYAWVITTMAAILLLVRVVRLQPDGLTRPLQYVFLAYALIFFIGCAYPETAQVLINLLLLAISVLVILKGVRTDRLEIMNYGLLILAALVICRFFDTEMSFLLRGFLFIVVGTGFFVTNYQMLSRRKKQSSLTQPPLP